MVTQAQINEITKRIVENSQPEKVILSGSYAKGNPTGDCDLDLLVVKDSNVPRYKREREIRKHLRGLKVPIDLIVYTEDEIQKWCNVKTAFITTVMKNGRVLYEVS
ncbi:MAG: nucleotidyltransferase domain-containing protein [candidate division KSB1 bacterium]|nr:nucleotidyltransferase domain-containing protein [candidate division KSB1 bacterium]MDZ7303285.1 nucleotidyltransferase domain-containing protein [candidate division KSB1 bacterium]MDZ7312589.1 nucleotidyltransferase domain-containing protein [candidate division KSB1 bacterium]